MVSRSTSQPVRDLLLEDVLFSNPRDPMEKVSNAEPLLTTAAVARWLGVSTRAICLWAECREIPAIKLGRQWRFRREEISNWLQSPKPSKVKNPYLARRESARV